MSRAEALQAAYAIGILNAEYHDRLLIDVDTYAEQANIPVDYVWSKLSEHCTEAEMSWIRSLRKMSSHGLIYTQTPPLVKGKAVSVPERMMAIAGACLRNYISARVMSVQEVLRGLKAGRLPSQTVILIPDFFIAAQDGGHMAKWEVSGLLGLLYSRLAGNQRTVLYIQDLDAFGKQYGSAFVNHVNAHYERV